MLALLSIAISISLTGRIKHVLLASVFGDSEQAGRNRPRTLGILSGHQHPEQMPQFLFNLTGMGHRSCGWISFAGTESGSCQQPGPLD
jgi:hypothetical protein